MATPRLKSPSASKIAQGWPGKIGRQTPLSGAQIEDQKQLEGDDMDNVTQPISNMASLGNGSVEALKGNVEAVMASSHIWASGCQAIGWTMAASAQTQLERNLSTWKVMTSIKSVREAMDLHARLTRTSVENVVAETGKLAEASIKLAEQAMVPITARMTLAGENLSPPALQK